MEKIYYNHYYGIAAKIPEEVGKQIAKTVLKHWEPQKFIAITHQHKNFYRAICVDIYGDAHSYSINKVEIIGG